MEGFLTWAVFFVWMSVVGCRPAETDRKNETKSALNTIGPKITKIIRTEEEPPTILIRVQRSTLPSRKSTGTVTRVDLISFLSTSDPTQTYHESKRDSSFFLTSDVSKLNILVVALAAVVMVLTTVIVVLGILRRSMHRKMQRIKEKKDDTTTTTTTDGAIAQYRETPPTESHFYNVEATHQPVEYEVPYAHQQAVTAQIMAQVNQNPTNNNLSNQTAPNGLSSTSIMDDGDYVDPLVFEAIVEETKTEDQTIADNKDEYKTPRNATKRAGLMSNEPLTDTSTMKDSRGYVMMMNHAGPLEDDTKNGHNDRVEERKHHVYDVPTTKTGLSADTFSRKTIKTKIKMFQEKQLQKGAKSKHVALAAEKEKVTQKDFDKESAGVKNTAYDTPRKV